MYISVARNTYLHGQFDVSEQEQANRTCDSDDGGKRDDQAQPRAGQHGRGAIRSCLSRARPGSARGDSHDQESQKGSPPDFFFGLGFIGEKIGF